MAQRLDKTAAAEVYRTDRAVAAGRKTMDRLELLQEHCRGMGKGTGSSKGGLGRMCSATGSTGLSGKGLWSLL